MGVVAINKQEINALQRANGFQPFASTGKMRIGME